MRVIVIAIGSEEDCATIEKLSDILGVDIPNVSNGKSSETVQDITGLLTTAEVAKRLRVCKRTLGRYRQSGDLPYITVGRRAYYSEADIQTFMSKNATAFNK